MRLTTALSLALLAGGILGPLRASGAIAEVHGATPTEAATVPRTQPRGPSDPAEVDRLLHRLFVDKMDSLHVPGAVVVLVKDGTVLLARGYGLADVARRTPMHPDSTVFRVGSISKLVTATAVMQLAERGRLRLTDDVNAHLSHFQLARSFLDPVTFATLLTHTSGFDEWHIGMAARSEGQVLPLRRYVAERAPPRVHPPGTTITYSNYGFALAGYLVASISGVSFEHYVEQNILGPLGMRASGFRLSSDQARRVAAAYTYRDGAYRTVPPDYFHAAPATAFATTGADAAKFMMAHLGGGRYGASRILADSSAREMHRQQFTLDARLPGVTYGFRERLDNGIRVLEHGGAVSGHTSFIVLAPDERWGLFVACNTSRCAVLQDLVDRLLEHYYGPNKIARTTLTPPPGFQRRARALVGTYRADVNPRENIEKLRNLFGEFTVTADSSRLYLRSPGGKRTSTWVEIAPEVFQQVGGSGHAAFRRAGTDGPARAVFSARSLPYATFVRQAWHERARCHLAVTTVLLALLVSACTCWPLGTLLQSARSSEGDRRVGARVARWNALLVAALLLIFVSGLIRALRGDLMQFMYAVPHPLAGILWIPWVSTALSLPLPVFVVLAWRECYWSGRARVHYTLVTAATIAAVPMLLYWNLLGAGL